MRKHVEVAGAWLCRGRSVSDGARVTDAHSNAVMAAAARCLGTTLTLGHAPAQLEAALPRRDHGRRAGVNVRPIR